MSQNDMWDFASLWARNVQGANNGSAFAFADQYATYRGNGGTATIETAYRAFVALGTVGRWS